MDTAAVAQAPMGWIIVVDNGAEDAVQDLVESIAGERAVYIPSQTNLGGAGGFGTVIHNDDPLHRVGLVCYLLHRYARAPSLGRGDFD